jgi:hypothetical protein
MFGFCPAGGGNDSWRRLIFPRRHCLINFIQSTHDGYLLVEVSGCFESKISIGAV